MSGFVGQRVATFESKKKQREERFKREAAKPPPSKPKRTFAHPGGKVTHNKEAALAAFLKRKGGKLTAQQQASLKNLERIGQYKGPTAETAPPKEKGPKEAAGVGTKDGKPKQVVKQINTTAQGKKAKAPANAGRWEKASWRKGQKSGKYRSKRFSKQGPASTDGPNRNNDNKGNGLHYRAPYSRSGRRVPSGAPKFRKNKSISRATSNTGVWRSVNTTSSKLREAGVGGAQPQTDPAPRPQQEHAWKTWSVPKKSWGSNALK